MLPFLTTTISGNNNDEIIGITSTKKNWIVAGNLVGDFFGTTPLNPLGGIDSWVSAFDSLGVNVWSLRVGTSEDDVATAIAADSKEQIWVAGLAQSDKDSTVIATTESSSTNVEAPPIQTPVQTPIQTPTVQTLNPDTVTSENLNPLRKDLKFLTVTQIDKNGLLINRYTTAVKNFGYVTAIISGSSGIYLIGIEIVKTGGERSFMQSLSSTGEFGPKFYFGKSATTLTIADIDAASGLSLSNSIGGTYNNVTAGFGVYTFYVYNSALGSLAGVIQDGATPVLGAFTKISNLNGTNSNNSNVSYAVYVSNSDKAFTNNTLVFS